MGQKEVLAGGGGETGGGGCGFQVHIHRFHLTGCGRVVAARSAGATGHVCHRFCTGYDNSGNTAGNMNGGN